MSKDSGSRSDGIGFGGALAILFIGLKLGHVIDWSWWWVLAPIWVPITILFGVLAVVCFVMLIVTVGEHFADSRPGTRVRR